ncbi:carboxy terminal-processing peptidase [Luteolibacter sp. LG18]|uniref:carboxy terminal-processing peptidase n=1 Tax=Luteolibacter sp. LG18 TaxID=2819286 RepID=UPI0030C70079
MSLLRFRLAALAATACVLSGSASAAQADFNEVGRQVAIMLQNSHYASLPFNAETGQRFLDDYLKQLDPAKVYFTAADVERFKATYGDELFKMLVQSKGLDAANDIYGTFRKRVEARGEMAKKFLKDDPLDFTGHDTIARTRKDAAWPKDDAEADGLLRQQLKEAVLSETVVRELQAKMAKDQGKPDPTQSEVSPREKVALRYERYLHTIKDAATDDIADGLLGAVARSYDPHTDYMIDREASRFNDSMRNELVGIGAELKPEDDGTTRIMGIMINGPADREGSLQLRDRILAVDTDNSGTFTDIKFMEQNKVVDLIRGKAGTSVRLQVQPATAAAGETKIVTVARGKVEIKGAQASAGIIDTKSPEGTPRRLGWITLPSFYSDFSAGKTRCSVDVEQFVQRLTAEKIDGLIFDLRNNGGGSLEEVRRMTGFFTGSGPVVQEKNTRGLVKASDTDDRKAIYDGPMVVLINKASASASEILAGALQDYGRAVIVGDSSTFGKGTVQEPLDVSKMLPFFSNRDGAGMLKLTIRKFYRPSGSSTQLDGVASDVILPGPADSMEIGEKFLDHAFPHDRIKPAPGFNPPAKDSLFLSRLQEASAKRVKADKDFGYYLDDAKRSVELRDKNSVSLNLEDRRKELFDLDARQEQRNAERRERFKTLEQEDAKSLKLTKLTLDDLAKGAAFHPYDPAKENEEYIRRAKDPVAELNDAPDWPSGLDPIKREGIKVLGDLIEATENAKIAEVTPKKEAEIR